MSTVHLTQKESLKQRRWYIVDAEGKVLGRLASRVANALRGKNKTCFSPHLDLGDFVIVVNARSVKLTGNKETGKVYYRHSGYPGGLRRMNAVEMRAKKPEEVIILAVRGMLPKNRLGRSLLKKLKVYPGSDHPHQAQQPEPLSE